MIVTQLLPGHHRLFGWKKVGRETRAPSPSPPTLCRHTGRVNGGWMAAFWRRALHKMDRMKKIPKRKSPLGMLQELPSGTNASWSFVGQVMVTVEAWTSRPITEHRVTSQQTENLYSATADGAQELPQHTWPPPLKVDNQYPLHRHADNSSSLCNQP